MLKVIGSRVKKLAWVLLPVSVDLHLWRDMHVVWHIYDAVPSVFGKCDDFEPGLTMLSPV